MKRLMIAAVLAAMAGGAWAAEKAPADAAPAKAEARAEAKRPARPAFDRAKFEARMKQRQAERRATVVEILKAGGVAEGKVQALADEIDKVYSARPPRPMPRRGKAGGERPRASGAK